jgi:succinate-semialdehyde dehydrogenase / glutarate-semialdehyde dehydrogenase
MNEKRAAMAYETINPYNGERVKKFVEHTDAEVETAIAKAQACFTAWKKTTFAERSAILSKAAHLLRRHTEKLARLITLEMGKLIADSRGEVALSADIIEYYAQHAEAFLATEILSPHAGQATIESCPIGVLFGIEPWNFPYYQLARFVAPNLMAGNVVMVKHAPSVPQCALAFVALFHEAGAPEGLYTNLFLSNDQAEHLIDDPRIKGVALTGSERAGSIVAAQAGKNLKKSTMELGGSDAFIVLEDAELYKTVQWAVWGRMNNTGQCCVAAKRFIVVDSIADRFIKKFQAELETLSPGDPSDASTTLGPLCSESALLHLLDQVKRSVAAGARVVLGGGRLNRKGAFMDPTILTDIKKGSPAYTEEFFGPVALFFPVANEEDAIALANDSKYGLGGSVFTSDIERGKRVAARIETGMVFVNHPTWTAPDLPFGGIKNSGYGRELSSQGIREFINRKLICVVPIDAPA